MSLLGGSLEAAQGSADSAESAGLRIPSSQEGWGFFFLFFFFKIRDCEYNKQALKTSKT